MEVHRTFRETKVLQGVEKSYDEGKFVLDESDKLRVAEEHQASPEDEPEGGPVLYRRREGPAPEHTGIGYKVFFIKEGGWTKD